MQKQTDVQKINCPHCGKEIPLSDVLTKQIELNIRSEYNVLSEKRENEFAAQLKQERDKVKEQAAKQANEAVSVELEDLRSQLASKSQQLTDSKKRELEFAKRQRELDERESSITLEVQRQLQAGKSKFIETAKESAALELTDLRNQLLEQEAKLLAAQKTELDLRKRERDLEEKGRNQELELERRLIEERKKISESAKNQIDEEYKLKLRENDIVMEALRKQIDELKRKSEQGSVQVQGEAQEAELYDILASAFKYDEITRVRKGKEGADDRMIVNDHLGNVCGSLLFESKRTKAWSDTWIAKAKLDQREAKANIIVIVSKVLPKEIQHMGNIEGVWVCDLQSAYGLTLVLRESLLQIGEARSALAGKSEKMEMMYEYLSGPHFKQRVEAIVEGFTSMSEGLEKEKRSMNAIWAQREKEIEKVVKSTSGLYGEVKGIIGRSLQEVKALELPSPQAVEETTEELPF